MRATAREARETVYERIESMKRMMVEGPDLRWPVRPGVMLFRIVLSALVATLGVAAAQPTHGAETLRWKFKPGETLRYTMVQQTTQGMKGAEVEKLQEELQNLTGRRKAMGQDFK